MSRQKKNNGPSSKDVYQERIRNELNLILRREVSDPRLTLASITKVELNQDFSMAKVYWDTFDASARGDVKKAFEGVDGRFRTLLAKNVKFRHTPALTFIYDSQYEDEMKITKLLNEEQDR